MTAKEAFKKITDGIGHIYGDAESASIAAIVLEDGFGVKYNKLNEATVLDGGEEKEINKMVERLLTHEPVQYVLGKTIFYGLPFKVDANVLIPRQETEELVAWIIETVRRLPSTFCRILDIGTGSGCIPIVLKEKLPNAEVQALDVSKGALRVANENAELNNQEIIFHEMDILNESLWTHLPKYDIIVSNPPYITQDEKNILAKNVIEFEPHLALFSGNNDAQRFVKKIIGFAKNHLNKNGFLFFETNEFHAEQSKILLEENGFTKVELRKDLNGNNRMLKGRG
ncbi:MAG: peptide chain release factor N(5)-glutamine methyltransferase [Bacteroidota bacterium]